MKKRRLPLNDENTLLVVTSFPENDHDALPLAIHAKHSLIELSKKQNILVLAEKLGKKITHIENKNLMIQRVWRRKKSFSLFSILLPVIKYTNIRNIVIQFDFDIYGGIKQTLILPWIVGFMKFLGKNVYFEFQQAPRDVSVIKRHELIGIKQHSKASLLKKLNLKRNFKNLYRAMKNRLTNTYIRLFYTAIGFLSDKIIVFEEDLRDRLRKYMSADKLVTVPVGVTEQKTMNKSKAKRRLGIASKEFVVLVFGFFDWNKGTDWITKVMSEMKLPNVRLLLVGGKNPALKDNEQYQAFCKEVSRTAKEARNSTIIGFVDEHKLHRYYSAADVVALPHREFTAAPATLTHSLGFHKPVIFSTNLIEFMKSPDFMEAMDEAQITDHDLFFSIDKNDLGSHIKQLQSDAVLYNKMVLFSKKLAQKRRSTHLTRDYQTLVSKSYALSPRFAFSK